MPATIKPRKPHRRQRRDDQRDRRKKGLLKLKQSGSAVNRLLENDLIRKVSPSQYREKIRRVYGGPQGALLATASRLSLHLAFGERLFRKRKFDLHGARQILDVGSGAGQIAGHLLKYSDAKASITCVDLSLPMLRRSRQRLRSDRPVYITADLIRLPFADGSFDCITCGYVLEHLPEARPGLSELARVLQPGGRMFLLTTEDSFGGAWTSRMWRCRTYDRAELLACCESLGLRCKHELWFSPIHQRLRAGGICVEIERV